MVPVGDIYCDMDGVLVDFYGGVYRMTGRHLENLRNGAEKDRVLKEIFDTGPSFWENLLPEHDFHQLWGFIGPFHPWILTAYPSPKHHETAKLSNNVKHFAEQGKRVWCSRYIHVPPSKVIVCERIEKANYATSVKAGHVVSNILIDDTADNINHWRANRGIGILHKNALDTIQQLEKILQPLQRAG